MFKAFSTTGRIKNEFDTKAHLNNEYFAFDILAKSRNILFPTSLRAFS